MIQAKTTGTYPLADWHARTFCVQANAGKSPGSDPEPLPGCDRDAEYTRKADTNRFCRAHPALPGNRVPGSELRATRRSTESSEIGAGRPSASCGPASTVTSQRSTGLSPSVQLLKLNLFVPTGATDALNERLAHGLPTKVFSATRHFLFESLKLGPLQSQSIR